MKRVILLSCFTALSAMATTGDKSSGGGDPLRFDFEQGKDQAIFILDNLSEASFDKASVEVRKYLLEYRGKLSGDLKKAPLDWDAPQSQKTCAHTDFRENAKIELSFDKCRGRIYSKEDAAKTLIHEASHHWGVTDETFADQVALAAYAAWESKKLASIPTCQGHELIAEALPGEWQVNNGISRLLPGGVPTKFQTLKLTNDPTAIAKIPGVGLCSFVSGVMTFEENGKAVYGPLPYMLTEAHGKLFLMSFKDGGDGTFNSEANMVTYFTERAKAPRGVLFVGGDHDDESVTAYEKKAPLKKP